MFRSRFVLRIFFKDQLMSQSKKPSLGFTLVELLVVIAIIGILVALLLPAVQAAREAARRMSCSNNMKQVGLAMHNYHDTYKSFPYGEGAAPTRAGASAFHGPNWRVGILPFIEQSTMYDQLDFNVTFDACNPGFAGTTNAILGGYTVPVYHCPSSSLPVNGANVAPSPTNNNRDNAQLIDYVGIAGSAPTGDPNTGIFPTYGACSLQTGYGGIYCSNGSLLPNLTVRFADITDGTSNTVMVAEQSAPIIDLNGTRRRDIRSNYYGGWSAFTSGVVPSSTMTGNPWGSGTTSIRYQINLNSAPVGADATWDANTILTSEHPGGIMSARADGSVDFISETIDMLQLKRLGARNDGQVQ